MTEESARSEFSARFERHRPRLEFWIASRMGPLLRARLAVDDVIQETFVEAQRSAETFEDRGEGSFRSWLFSIAENRLRDLHKYHAAQKRHPRREVDIGGRTTTDSGLAARLAVLSSTPGTKAMKRELFERLVRSVDRLDEPLKEVVLQRVVEDRSFREIGERLGKAASTVQTQYSRALDELRKLIDSDPDGDA